MGAASWQRRAESDVIAASENGRMAPKFGRSEKPGRNSSVLLVFSRLVDVPNVRSSEVALVVPGIVCVMLAGYMDVSEFCRLVYPKRALWHDKRGTHDKADVQKLWNEVGAALGITGETIIITFRFSWGIRDRYFGCTVNLWAYF